MPTIVDLPDGTQGEFPDSMDDDAIKAALRTKYPPKDAPPRIEVGLGLAL
jgi:hypothetical protein